MLVSHRASNSAWHWKTSQGSWTVHIGAYLEHRLLPLEALFRILASAVDHLTARFKLQRVALMMDTPRH